MKKKTSSKRAMFKKGLVEAAQRSYETKDSFGESEDFFKKGLKIQKWFPKDGEHLINIIPYIAGETNPNQQEGYATHMLDLWVHQRVGPSSTSHVCLLKNYKKPCPLCDLQREMRKEGFSEKEIKALQPKRRVLYNIVCLDSLEEEQKGVQIWNVAHWFMEQHLAQLAKNPKGGGFLPFQDPDIGKSISWTIESQGAKNKSYIGHRFVDRDTEVPDEQLEEAHTLDEIIHIPTYEELRKVADTLRGDVEENASEDNADEVEEQFIQAAKKTKKKAKVVEPEPEEEEEEYEDEEEDEEDVPWEDEEEEDEEEEDEEEPEPEPEPKRKIKKPVGRLRKK